MLIKKEMETWLKGYFGKFLGLLKANILHSLNLIMPKGSSGDLKV